MSKPRFNPYNVAHKALRNLLSQVSLLAGNIDYKNEMQLDELKAKGKDLIDFLDMHADAEEKFLLPALEERVLGSTKENIDDHVVIEEQAEKMDHMLKALSITSPPTAGPVFYQTVSNFHAAYLEHMAMEEGEVLSLIWDNFSDEELMALLDRIMASFSPEVKFMSFKYIIPALNPFERMMVLNGFKAKAPASAVESVLAMLKNNMPVAEYEQMLADISQPVA